MSGMIWGQNSRRADDKAGIGGGVRSDRAYCVKVQKTGRANGIRVNLINVGRPVQFVGASARSVSRRPAWQIGWERDDDARQVSLIIIV